MLFPDVVDHSGLMRGKIAESEVVEFSLCVRKRHVLLPSAQPPQEEKYAYTDERVNTDVRTKVGIQA